MNTALVFAAHPDDEVLGCGATIARLAAEGWNIHVLIIAEGATSRSNQRNISLHQEALSNLAKAAELANNSLGAKTVKLCSMPDNRLDSLNLLDIVKVVEAEIERNQPRLVFTHHAGDLNIDHRVLHEAVITACRPLPNSSVKSLLFFEVPSSTEWRPSASGQSFLPNYYYDVSEYLIKKLEALEIYQSEIRSFPHPRSFEAVRYLAQWRGATVGCLAAEAFMLGRTIV